MMLFVWCFLAGIILLLAPAKITGKFHLVFSRVFSWPLEKTRNITLSSTVTSETHQLDSQEEKYQNYIVYLEQQLHAQHEKIEQLTGIRDRMPFEGVSLVIAEIVTISSDTNSQIIINRGSNDGIKNGLIVLANNSVIGQVVSTNARTAKVMTLTDINSKIPVKIGNSDINRVMIGKGSGKAKINFVPIETKVKIGSLVITHQPGKLDSPMIVGKISNCQRDSKYPTLWDITVTPACDIEKLSTVSVLISNQKAKE